MDKDLSGKNFDSLQNGQQEAPPRHAEEPRFVVIGIDGKTYGPVPAQRVREWILDHRVHGATLARKEDSELWRPVREFPEFREALERAYGEQREPPPVPLDESPKREEEGTETRFVLDPEAKLSLWNVLGQSWAVWISHPFLVGGACFVVWFLQLAVQPMGFLGGTIELLLTGPLYGGLYLLILEVIRSRKANLSLLFTGFQRNGMALILTFLVIDVLTKVGLLLVLPGIVWWIFSIFALVIVADKGCLWTEGIQQSLSLVSKRFWTMTGLVLLAFLPLFTYTVYETVVLIREIHAYTQGVGSLDKEAIQGLMEQIRGPFVRMELIRQFVRLVNMPFAFTAIASAYWALHRPIKESLDRGEP